MGDGTHGSPSMIVQESSSAKFVEYWPNITIADSDRRKTVFQAAKLVLENAEKNSVTNVGFYTMGLETACIPSWEIAEEIIRAINRISEEANNVRYVSLIASSPTQLSSFQYALNNAQLYSTLYQETTEDSQ